MNKEEEKIILESLQKLLRFPDSTTMVSEKYELVKQIDKLLSKLNKEKIDETKKDK